MPLGLLWLGIYGVHGPICAYCSPCLHAIDDPLADFSHLLLLFLAELSEHEAYLLSFAEVVSDSDSDAGLFLGAYQFCDVGQSVVSSCASVLSESECSERNVEVVRDDDHVLNGYLELVHPVTYSLSAEVHICGWLEQKEFSALE